MKILAVCGCGVGSSMVLKIFTEKALQQLGIRADVEQADVTVAGSYAPDIIMTSETFERLVRESGASGSNTRVIAIRNYTDVAEYVSKIKEALSTTHD